MSDEKRKKRHSMRDFLEQCVKLVLKTRILIDNSR